ncbi:MAG: zf-HC2 domain-containing protein [Candidatus Omnitrophica bacterium]|nr:zf-HC2 domain-containing protein [Candidatus Omnitrophota bacterium]
MKCNHLNLLNRYADNELTAIERESFQKHLKVCSACAKELQIVLNMKQSISSNKIQTNPEFFWQQLKARIAQENRGKASEVEFDFGGWARRLIPVPIAVGIIAVAILNMIPENSNPVDEYVFGNGNGSVIELIEQPGNQSVLGG